MSMEPDGASAETATEAREPQAPPFELPEYQRAFITFTRQAIEGLSSAKDPILAKMRRRSRPQRSYVGRNSMPEGEVHEAAPMPVKSEFSLTATEMLDGDPTLLAGKLVDLAEGYLASLMPQVFAAIAAATEAAGTTINAGGQPFSADLFIGMLEKLELEFDDAGQINLDIVTGPGMSVPTYSEDDQRRIGEVIERKRQEFVAKRRRRQLPQHPLRG